MEYLLATAPSNSPGPTYCGFVDISKVPEKLRYDADTRTKTQNVLLGCERPMPIRAIAIFLCPPNNPSPLPRPVPGPHRARHACGASQWPVTSAVRCLAEASWAMLVLLGVYLMAQYTARTNVAMCQAANLCASQPAYYHAPCNGKSRGTPGRRAARCDSSCRAPRHKSL